MGHEGQHKHIHHDHDHDHGHDHGMPRGPRSAQARRGDPWGGERGGRGRFGGERGGWGGGRRMRRGDIRRSILAALKESPAHGYEVMRRLEEMSGGLWRPSPGSVYPHLQMLEDEGMVRSSEVDGTRIFTLTEAGEAEAAKGTGLPWDQSADGENQIRTLRLSAAQLMSAAKQLSGAGAGPQVERGIAVLKAARREIYQILAED